MASGFVTAIAGKEIMGTILVVGKVRHRQSMSAKPVNIWIIADKDGPILSAHCIDCMAGLQDSLSAACM